MKKTIKTGLITLCTIMALQVSIQASDGGMTRITEMAPITRSVTERNLTQAEVDDGYSGYSKWSTHGDIDLKKAYDKALPFATDAMVISTHGSGGIGILVDPENKYSKDKKFVGPIDNYTYSYAFRDFETLNGERRKGLENLLEMFRLYGGPDMFTKIYSETLKMNLMEDEKTKPKVVQLNMPLAKEYPGIVLDNIVYHKGVMYFLVKYPKKATGDSNANPVGDYISIIVYNKKTGVYTMLDTATVSGNSYDFNLIQFGAYTIEPEDLKDLEICYDKQQFEKNSKALLK